MDARAAPGDRKSGGGIFISYRRQDTPYPAAMLYERLRARFGSTQIFKDVDNLEPGDDFVEKITTAVGSCDVLLALIGSQWLTINDEEGKPRLGSEGDFVQLEIATALNRGIRVIPILVDGAQMPRRGQVPDALAGLVRRQAVELNLERFNGDADRIVGVLRRTLAEVGAARERDAPAARTPAPTQRTPPPAQRTPPPKEHTSPPKEHTSPPAQRTPPPKEHTSPPKEHTSPPVQHLPPAPARPPPPARTGRSTRSARIGVIAGIAAAVVLVPLVIVLVVQGLDRSGSATGSGDSQTTSPPSGTQTPTPTPTPEVSGIPAVLAHRGGREAFPVQTVQAFEEAAKAGYGVETDVRWTSDGVAVLVHNEAATDGVVCDGSYPVSRTTWDTLRGHCRPADDKGRRSNYRLSTFQEGAAVIADYPSAQFFPEVKVNQTDSQVSDFLDVLRTAGIVNQTVVTSALPDELAKIRKRATQMALTLRLMLFVNRQVPVPELARQGLVAVAVERKIATTSYIEQLHERDLKVVVWTLDTVPEWQLARSVGADAVLTGYPRRYSAWLKE